MCNNNVPNPAEYDYVGFAYPIHAFNAPYLVYEFVRKLPIVQNKNVFVVKTSGEPLALNNASSLHLADKLKRKGYFLTNEYHYVMPYNIIFRHTDLQAQKMWNTAKLLVPIDVNDILKGNKNLPKQPFFGRFVSWLLRIEHRAMRVNGKFFKVSNDCTKCMQCVKNCPTKNITYNKETGKFQFSDNCAMCARCAFQCPQNAVRIGILDGWRVNGKYNFEYPDETQVCKKPDFCKKAYQRYFEEAEKRIAFHQENVAVAVTLAIKD